LEVKRLFSGNDSKFKTKLAAILPRIKGGEAVEAELLSLIRRYDESSFGEPMYRKWYGVINDEIEFFEVILKNLGTFNNSNSKIILCESRSIARRRKYSNKQKGYGNGWYELNLSLTSCLDQRLIDHLETELNNPNEEDISAYPIKPGFNTDCSFNGSLAKMLNDFQNFANLQDNSSNENLCFVAVTNYPADENSATMYFESGDSANTDVNLLSKNDLKMKKASSDEDGYSRFAFQVLPRSKVGGTILPDISIEFRHKSLADIEFKHLEIDSVIDKETSESIISASIASSNICYLAQARVKYIGGAVGPWLDCEAFCCVTFENMRYVSEEHALSVDISLDDNFANESEGNYSKKQTPFDVEFQYRHVGSEDELFSKVKAISENGKRFKVLLGDDEGGDLEYRCRYVAKGVKVDKGKYSWMKGSKEGEWSTLQSYSKSQIYIYIMFLYYFIVYLFLYQSNYSLINAIFIHSYIGQINLDGVWYKSAKGKFQKQATVEGKNLTMIMGERHKDYSFTVQGNSKIILPMKGTEIIGELTSTPQITWTDTKGKTLMKWSRQCI
jgi:hypothetical protein